MTPSAASPLPRSAPEPDVVNSFAHARAFALCVEKARRNLARLADRPVAAPFAADGNYFAHEEEFFAIGNWTSSFFTGMALLAFAATRDAEFVRQCNRLAGVYAEKVTTHRADTMHDLGFLYSLYSVALFRLTGARKHRQTGLLAADELAKRFCANGRYLQAWGRMDDTATDYAGLAIIDCLMNLPLLFWAARETGNTHYHELAVQHADTTLARFVRADDSVCHAFRFAPDSGAPVGPDNYCGRTVDSHWARGTAWAIYGFALAYRHTRESRFLAASARLARKLAGLLDAEVVPPWDFRLPRNEPPLRDSSAAAIVVCGLDELCAHDPASADLAATAERLLAKLCTPAYFDAHPDCPGLLRAAEVGDGLVDGQRGCYRAKSVYASWGDYFFMEALARRLHAVLSFW